MNRLLLLIVILFTLQINAQNERTVRGKIIEAGSVTPLESVNIVNLNKVIGTATNQNGEFTIRVNVNDTLHLSYLGYKSIKVRVTNDWINFATSANIEMTELALVASALGIGIGLGLQNIVNNFVSGLLILLEKSLKVFKLATDENMFI